MEVNVFIPHLGRNFKNNFKIRLQLLFFALCFETNMSPIGSAPSTWPSDKKAQRAAHNSRTAATDR